MTARKFVLVDASVAAAYYAPVSTTSANLIARAKTLFEGKSDKYELTLLMPSFVIAETFAVFEKWRWGYTWNKQVKRKLTPRNFDISRSNFRNAIHNGRKIIQIEVNRYHILCVDLIAPINASYKIVRNRGKKKSVSPDSTYDMMFLSMGIWMNKIYSKSNVVLVTGDARMTHVANRACAFSPGREMAKHLADSAETVGIQFSNDIYPKCINFTNCAKRELNVHFPNWDLEW